MSRTFGVATLQMACASNTAIVIGSQAYNTGILATSHRQPVLKGHAAVADPTPLIARKRTGVKRRRVWDIPESAPRSVYAIENPDGTPAT